MKKLFAIVLVALALCSCQQASNVSGKPKPEPEPPVGFGDPVLFPRQGSMAWDGTNYAIAWGADIDSGRVVYFQLFTESGTPVGSPLSVYEYGNSIYFGYFIQLIWTGQEYAAFWRCGSLYGVSMARISREGLLIDGPREIVTPTRLSNSRLDYEVTWTGTEFGVAWYDGGPFDTVGGSVKLTRVGSSGSPVGTFDFGHYDYFGGPNKPAVTGAGDCYAVCWVADLSRFLAATTTGDSAIGPSDLAHFDLTCQAIELATAGTDYGLIWEIGGDLDFLLLDKNCAKRTETILLSHQSSPTAIWTGQEFAMSSCDWEGYPICSSLWQWGLDVHFVRFGKGGTILQDTCLDVAADYPGLVWRNPGYTVSYRKELIGYESCSSMGYSLALRQSK